ncbi:putative quinol monooxygenase [Streptomyces sp. NBC_00525]|uniref:putative quinol monooxygenase n=1 Tax=Streptomyces sp. NBC_00525 TaxID=2903660 RepID=UPI002E80261B|nr:putative quinol monooxygenase [Streptomyces sp. NBC_00525]WUC95433.1 antibiotic biosynthesis monooxygenase [Streptomyces sp. NBC_00525]
MSVTVVARWIAGEGHADRIEELLADIAEKSLAEPGCLAYSGYRADGSEREFVLVEEYADAGALERHQESDHYRELVLGAVVPLLTERHVGRYTALRAA